MSDGAGTPGPEAPLRPGGPGDPAGALPTRAALRRFRESRPARLGLGLVLFLVVFALAGPWICGHDPDISDFTLSRDRFGAPPGPSAAHWLGVDPLFRDLFARLAAGARISLAIAVLATLLTTVLGAVVGVTAGMSSGTRLAFLDTILMRVVDVVLALPFLLFVTAVGVAVGRADTGTLLLILALGGWTGTARLVRARTLQIKGLDYVTAARALGAGSWRIVRRHVLPGVTGTLIVLGTSSVAQMILAEAVLGYLTVGIQPPRATWGRMLHEGEPYLGTRLALIAVPGVAILLAVLGWNRLGEGLRDALDPRGSALAAPSRRLPVDLLLAGAALLLVGAAVPNGVVPPRGKASAGLSPKPGGVLHVASMVNLRTLDPALAYDEAFRSIAELLFARLITFDAEGRLVPDLAAELPRSVDGRSYTFELRPGLHFHDGSELLARDVQRSFERLLHPKSPTPGASLYLMIQGAKAFHEGKAEHLDGVRVTGDRRLTIELEAPDATFLSRLTMPFAAPVCASAGLVADPRSAALPCGAGPFRATSWEPDRGLILRRNEAYHQPGRPYLDGVEWLVSVPARSQRYKFEKGELDFTHDLSASEAALFRAGEAWAGQHRWVETQGTNGVFLNTELPPFDRREVRRAVSKALDPSVLTRLRPDMVVADRIVPPSIPGVSRQKAMRAFDLPGALADMARAGYPFDPATGRGGYPEPIDYIAVPDTWDQQTGEIWQQQLARIGIRLRLRLVTYAAFLAETGRRRAVPMGKAGWNADFPDASNFFEPILATAAIDDEGSENAAFFSSPALDALLARAHGEPDPERRAALYEDAETLVRDEAPWIPTFGVLRFEIWQPRLRGHVRQAVIQARFDQVWIDEGEGPSAALLPGAPPLSRRRRP
jgi:ABC-type dipeptide/oligopeptide/nickel transport system permease subunit/ABC-type transport system substrate-binding protein